MMSTWQNLIFFLIMSLTTIMTRVLPFLLFPDQARTPAFVRYLGHVLPYPVIGMLVVYCFKDLSVRAAPYGLPELIAVIAIVLVHLWRKNALISIGSGTVVYMLLIQLAF